MDHHSLYIALVLLLPLAGGLVSYLAGRQKAIQFSLVGMVPGAAMSGVLLYESVELPIVLRWEWIPGLELGWNIDHISAVLICLVYLISILVHLFSAHYLNQDRGIHRYFAKLGFFTSSMLGLLAADHLLLLFIFWELVGLSSYLLIGYWFENQTKARSAREVFMINRVADAGLLIGVILMITELNQPFLSELGGSTPPSLVVHLAGFGLLIGALGKSAQFPFFGWLTKAMAGPTPISALIHAATMVAAGVYLLVRVVPFLTTPVLYTTAGIGAITAFMAAIAALTQHDIKKVLAYSTISQLGYMVMGVGVGAYQASLFHLWTHAFFKAGLFLAAGAVIHYFHSLHADDPHFDGQDMRQMGGLRKMLPVTHIVFLVCGLALSGLPFFSGFLSKEGILAGAWTWAASVAADGHWMAYIVSDLAFVTALLTPIYIGRQILLIFYGQSRSAIKPMPYMEPLVMVRIPLLVLAVGSLWVVNALNPFNAQGWLLKDYLFAEIIEGTSGFEYLLSYTLILSIGLTLGGLAISYLFFRPAARRVLNYQTAGEPDRWYARLSYRGWYLERVYEWVALAFMKLSKVSYTIDRRVIDLAVNGIGVGTVVFSKAMAIIDREIVDGLVNFVAWVADGVGDMVTRVQAARVQNQLLWMVFLLILLVWWSQV